VIDKDLTSALLARELDADALLLLTDVEGVLEGWPSASARRVPRIRPGELRRLGLAPGTMGPKAEAAACFVEWTGRRAAIGRLEDAARVLDGEAGTSVVP
jgi:carbamate kinase